MGLRFFFSKVGVRIPFSLVREISALRTLHHCHATVIRSNRPLYRPATNSGSTLPRSSQISRQSLLAPHTKVLPLRLASAPHGARFSRRALILFSGPYARPDGLVAFLQRLGLEVVPVDNDPNGGDRTHDILDNEFYSSLLRRSIAKGRVHRHLGGSTLLIILDLSLPTYEDTRWRPTHRSSSPRRASDRRPGYPS